MTEINAQLNYLRIAPRKVRLVADLLRGLPVTSAESELRFITKRASLPISKLLNSAIANAKSNSAFHGTKDDLYIKTIKVDGGPVLKRSMPRARGRAFPIRKETSHITLILSSKQHGA